MNVSYNWLKNYINITTEPAKVAETLTSIGLEVGSIEAFQSIKGGLEGLVVGQVLTCTQHPNADKLSVTTVNIGSGEPLPIVCGAPNVAAGQKVIVATVGTTLYTETDSFQIKKAKIRGEVSEGMLCGEDEIGVGKSHDGIIVLPENTPVGLLAKDYFKVENDNVIEVDITPNRIDSASHYGIARDLAATLSQTNNEIKLTSPSVDEFKTDNSNFNINVIVKDFDACPRYSGVTISDIEVKTSPDWLQNRLKAIGLTPINNIVDVTNFVLHELGQPLHAFDGDKISGNTIEVKMVSDKTKFTTLDGKQRELSNTDLMICNANEPMCIAGVFGGLESGVSQSTTKIFLESAYFNAISVRKTAKRHLLNTDASFRFERGTDPNMTVFALKRAALLIKQVAGGTISSNIIDIYPTPVPNTIIDITFEQINQVIGKNIPINTVKSILKSLEIEIVAEQPSQLTLSVPPYRVDVTRPIDVIEEILRIYGYNNIELPTQVRSSLGYEQKPNHHNLRNTIAQQLVGAGFQEVMCNSLTKASYYNNLTSLPFNQLVTLANPLSNDLNAMRQTLLFGMLELAQHNRNRKQSDLHVFEFGNCYFYNPQIEKGNLNAYTETQQLSILTTGNSQPESWYAPTQPTTFFTLKTQVENTLFRLGCNINNLTFDYPNNDLFAECIQLNYNTKAVALLGKIHPSLLKAFDIDKPLFFATINWNTMAKISANATTIFTELPKFPEVKRDLALLIDKTIPFASIKELAFKTEKKLLKKVSLFDVYEGEKLGADKKSYAVSFILQDPTKTLADAQIDKIMQNLIQAFSTELNAQLR